MTKINKGYGNMLNTLSKRIADFLFRQKCFDEELLPVYVYGVELFLSSLLGVGLVLALGLLLNEFICSIVFLLSFIILRLFTGGFHCNSYFKCNLSLVITSLVVTILKNIIVYAPVKDTIFFIMIVLSFLITILLAPISHPNKTISQKESVKFKIISLLILCIHTTIAFIFKEAEFVNILILTDFISSIYIIIGLIKNIRERSKFYETQKENR